MSRPRVSALVVVVLFMSACPGGGSPDAGGDDDAGPADAGAALTWFTTCGDPACGGFTAPTDVDACDDEAEGASCTTADAECYVDGDMCNVRLRCTDEDPKGMCPISRRGVKDHIRPLTVDDEATLARALLATPLSTWRYRDDDTTRLGFIIGEGAPAFAVRPGGRQVDVYGYTSLAVAALKAQQRTIEELTTRIEQLERRCGGKR